MTMKANLELEERELKRLMKKTPLIVIKFPKLEQRTYYIALSVLLASGLIFGGLMNERGYKNGLSSGYTRGYQVGEKKCIDENRPDLSLSESLAYFVRYNISGIAGWFAVVVGLGWVVHGVGFKIT